MELNQIAKVTSLVTIIIIVIISCYSNTVQVVHSNLNTACVLYQSFNAIASSYCNSLLSLLFITSFLKSSSIVFVAPNTTPIKRVVNNNYITVLCRRKEY